jgi:hypothetical protein
VLAVGQSILLWEFASKPILAWDVIYAMDYTELPGYFRAVFSVFLAVSQCGLMKVLEKE